MQSFARFICLNALLMVAGCNNGSKDDTADTGPDTESPYTKRDTSAWVDTSTPGETADSARVDTQGDTGDTGFQTPGVDALALFPDGISVFPGGTYSLRLTATLDGATGDADLTLAAFSSSDEAVATVDVSGGVIAVAEGETTLSAEYEGLSVSVVLSVVAAGTVTVRVEDYHSGEPITEGVWLFGESFEVSGADKTGLITAELSEASAADLTVAATDYVPVTLHGTVSRDVTIRMRTLASIEATEISLVGDVDFSMMTAGGLADLQIGLASSSFSEHPLFFNPESLMSESRTLTIYGVDATVPSNIYVDGYAEDWSGDAVEGDFGVWTMGGPVAISELTSGLNGSSDALALFVDNLSNFSYQWQGSLTGVSGDSLTVDLQPSQSFDEVVIVTVPDLPAGFYGSEDSLVMILEETVSDGFATVGLGRGQGDVVAMRVASSGFKDSVGTRALALAQVGGLGSAGAVSYSVGVVDGGEASLPEFQEPPVLADFDLGTHDFSLTANEAVTAQHILVECGDGFYREGVIAGGAHSATLPHVRDAMDCNYGRTNWTIWSYELTRGTFEGLATDGGFRAPDVEDAVERTTRLQTSL